MNIRGRINRLEPRMREDPDDEEEVLTWANLFSRVRRRLEELPPGEVQNTDRHGARRFLDRCHSRGMTPTLVAITKLRSE